MDGSSGLSLGLKVFSAICAVVISGWIIRRRETFLHNELFNIFVQARVNDDKLRGKAEQSSGLGLLITGQGHYARRSALKDLASSLARPQQDMKSGMILEPFLGWYFSFKPGTWVDPKDMSIIKRAGEKAWGESMPRLPIALGEGDQEDGAYRELAAVLVLWQLFKEELVNRILKPLEKGQKRRVRVLGVNNKIACSFIESARQKGMDLGYEINSVEGRTRPYEEGMRTDMQRFLQSDVKAVRGMVELFMDHKPGTPSRPLPTSCFLRSSTIVNQAAHAPLHGIYERFNEEYPLLRQRGAKSEEPKEEYDALVHAGFSGAFDKEDVKRYKEKIVMEISTSPVTSGAKKDMQEKEERIYIPSSIANPSDLSVSAKEQINYLFKGQGRRSLSKAINLTPFIVAESICNIQQYLREISRKEALAAEHPEMTDPTAIYYLAEDVAGTKDKNAMNENKIIAQMIELTKGLKGANEEQRNEEISRIESMG